MYPMLGFQNLIIIQSMAGVRLVRSNSGTAVTSIHQDYSTKRCMDDDLDAKCFLGL